MIFGNPVRQAFIRPPGSARISGNFRVTQDFGPTPVTAEARVVWPGGEGIAPATYAHFHRALDLGNGKCGADVIAAAAGKVITAGKASDGAIRVIVDHGNGWTTGYWHLHDEVVSVGQKLGLGQLLGHLGSTGNSTACHLHFYVKQGTKYLDPWRRLAQNVTVHPTGLDPVVNIRSAPGSGSTPGDKFAQTKADGRIHRLSDNADLGDRQTERKWGGTAKGAAWDIDGIAGDTWEAIELDGALRYLATPLAVLSQPKEG
jgi:murein DD-endopeptidase MepM/ murein hydrolase activator NlpD